MVDMQNLPAVMRDCYEHINGFKEEGANNQKLMAAICGACFCYLKRS
jgi:hypothetical protein